VAAKKKEKYEGLSIEDAFSKVEETIEDLQEDDINLEDAFSKYKDGMDLLKHINAQIDNVEKEALKISRDGKLELLDEEE